MSIREVLAAHKTLLTLVGTSGVSLFLGSCGTYFVLNEKLKKKYELIVAKEMEDTKEYYARLHKEGSYADPIEMAERIAEEDEELADALTKLQDYDPSGTFRVQVSEDEQTVLVKESIEQNIFDVAPSFAKFEVEEADRKDPTIPYIISKDEYYNSETNYEQLDYSYFEGDGILCDQDDASINFPDEIVGEANLQKFGYGSKDHNVVYVRNDRLEQEYCITRSAGTYTEIVHGTIRHSADSHKSRKFRGFDE